MALTAQNQVKWDKDKQKGQESAANACAKGRKMVVLTCWGYDGHTHEHTAHTHSCSFLMREKPLSRKSVMSRVAGCEKLSLRLCLTLALLSFLLNPFFFSAAVRTVHVALPSLHSTFAHLSLITSTRLPIHIHIKIPIPVGKITGYAHATLLQAGPNSVLVFVFVCLKPCPHVHGYFRKHFFLGSD